MCRICAEKSEKQQYANEIATYDTWLDMGVRFASMSKEEIAKAVADNDLEDKGGEEFLPAELIIAATLGLAFKSVGDTGTDKLLTVLETEGAHKLEKALDEARPHFEQVFAYKDTETRVKANLRSAMLVGAEAAGSKSLITDMFRVDEILKEMLESTKYFTNSYFNKQVAPELQKIVEKIFNNPGVSGMNVDAEAYKAVREAMEARLKSVPHWRVVANAAASRSFHYGAVKAGMVVGQRSYKIVAVLDTKTSEICKHMNGKEFWLADGEVQATKAAAADGDAIKDAAPWLAYKAIKNLSIEELREAGFILPPFHGNCRSTIRFI